MTDRMMPALPKRVAAQVARFVTLDQPRAMTLAALDPRVADLAWSFPLLFAALVQRYGPLERRLIAITKAVDGAPLMSVADIMGLPYALRHLAPEACPRSWMHRFWSPAASRQLRSLIPAKADAARRWVETVALAAAMGDETIALWLARQKAFHRDGRARAEHLVALVMFAWMSMYHPVALGPVKGWSADIGASEAFHRCQAWLGFLDAVVTFGGTDTSVDPWIARSMVGELEVVPLVSAIDISEEAHVMDHCVRDYVPGVVDGSCRLFSIRTNDARIATMEIKPDSSLRNYRLAQIAGPGNTKCAPLLSVTLSEFASAQPVLIQPEPLAVPPPQVTFANLMQGYRDALPHEAHYVVDLLSVGALLSCQQALYVAVGKDIG